jgi:hypothetical protein
MTRAKSIRIWAFRLAGTFCVLASVYFFIGVLQAASLYTGERALFNANLWASLSLLFGIGATHLFRSARPSATRVSPGVARFLTVFWAAIFLAAAWQVVSHLLAVDRCVDQGASFDYLRGECDLGSSHSVISLGKTHGFLLVTVVLAAIHSALALRRSRDAL